ncbi:alpha/beta hydrolase [Methanoculleus sp. Wushi-C6]|uniref:Alpha/beta hydrolase n=1 Tax=Methanoculleus caldifontis TaxID=2651577 RepID=A0ABU3WY36_9EURY|nr:alpha/beta hydrolase [Methanoculleus sp. Wushi-C6]MDV2480701.1 alpha/beta hydrolase [Methanoculleus sp. Wushi-C6]
MEAAEVLSAIRAGLPVRGDRRRPEVEPVAGLPAYRLTTAASRADRTVLFFHGGRFTSGSTAESLDICARIADAACAEVISVDYRLAPAHPFPAAVVDCLAAYRHLLMDGYAPERVVPVGLSAGGTLALSMLLSAGSQGLPMPAAGVLLSPPVEMLFLGDSVLLNRRTDWLAPQDLAEMREDYLLGADPADPLASPLYADLSGLPPLMVQAGGGEVLIDGICAFVSTARLQGVPVTFDVAEGMFHCWQAFAAVLPEGAAAIERVGAFVRRHVPNEG